MKNLEQIRARNALLAAAQPDIKGKKGGDVVNKIPGMIRNNGILAAAAFAKKCGGGHQKLFDELAKHLSTPELKHCEAQGLSALIDALVKMDAAHLRAVTDETIAFLGYVRRFHNGGE